METRAAAAVATRSTRDSSAPPDGPRAAPPVPAPVTAGPLALNAGLTLDAAFARIVHHCLDQVQGNVAGVLARDAECLHQMRVGWRRLRAALDLFKHLAPLPAALQRDLDWLAALLGKARDWDVFLFSTLDAVGGDAWQAGRSALRGGAARHASAAHRAVHAALRSARHTRLLVGLSAWIIEQPWRHSARAPASSAKAPLRKALRPLLAQAQRRLLRRLRQADAGDPASLHRVRIAVKKARYAVQFFQSLLPAKPAARHLQRLAALQDGLGSLNDLVIGRALLAQLEPEAPPPARHVAFADGYLAALGAAAASALRAPLAQARRRNGPEYRIKK